MVEALCLFLLTSCLSVAESAGGAEESPAADAAVAMVSHERGAEAAPADGSEATR
jgi:hypothetical protein